jgi:hypothetical protein
MKARMSILAVMAALVFAFSSGAPAADPGQRAGEEPRQFGPKPERPEAVEKSDVKPEPTQAQEEKKAKEAAETKAAERIDEPLESSKFKGAKVKNGKDEDLGIVSDLIIEPSGRVDFVIVSGQKGLLGDGKKIAVPYRAFRFIPEKGDERVVFVLNMDKEEFGRAPDYRDDPRIFTDEERTAKIYRFYGIQPATQEGSVTQHERSEQMGERREKPSEYGKEEGSQRPMGTTRGMAPEGEKK